nr:hypothetical protein [Xenococcaceae cyanobacterium MO_207.B15]
MKTNYLTLLGSSILATGLSLSTSISAQALTLNFDSSSLSSNNPATGASASINFSFMDDGNDQVKLILDIDNTTGDFIFGAGASQSVLTGFAFDLPSFPSDLQITAFTGDQYFDTLLSNVEFQPFSNNQNFGVGNFNAAVADNNNFEGGNANNALPESDRGNSPSNIISTVELTLSGTGIDATSLETDFTNGFADGSLDAAVRFQQVNAGEGSDKLLFQPSDPGGGGTDPIDVPEPGTILGLGLFTLGT